MRRRRAWYPLVVRPGLVVLGVGSALLWGCRTARDDASGGTVMATPAVLAKSVEDYRSREFLDLPGVANDSSWRGAPPEERECDGCPPGQTTRVAIEAMAGAHTIDLRALPEHGVVIARFRNLGNGVEKMYDVPPATSNVRVYLVIEPLPPAEWVQGRPSARLKSVHVTPGNNPVRVSTHVEPLVDCGHEHDTVSDTTGAAFTGCEKQPPPPGPGGSVQQAFLGLKGWISCVHGCCEVGRQNPA